MSWSRVLLALGLFWAAPRMASAACPATPDQVADEANRAAQAFILMDEVAYTQALAGMREGLGCLTGPPTAAQSALVHRAEALDAFATRDAPRGVAALRAMRECDPLLGLSDELAPAGGPLHGWYAEARTLPVSPRVPAAVPGGLTLVVDGRPADGVPTERASVAVLLYGREVVWSALLPAGAPLPPVTPPAPDLEAPPRWPVASLAGAGALGLAAGGLWVAGLVGRGQVLDAQAALEQGEAPAYSAAELGRVYDRSRGALLAAELGTALALGLGAVGVVGVVRW